MFLSFFDENPQKGPISTGNDFFGGKKSHSKISESRAATLKRGRCAGWGRRARSVQGYNTERTSARYRKEL